MKLVNFVEFFGHRFQNSTNGERPGGEEEDPVEEEGSGTVIRTTRDPPDRWPKSHWKKPRVPLTVLTKCTIKIHSC